MKSPQLIRLQQQFLKSLHAEPSSWLLNEIEPAPGFGTAENVLNTYLSRAVSRTVDPLKQIFRHVRWILGAELFEHLLSNFYAQSFGEPLSPMALSVEFAAFVENEFDQRYCDLMQTPLIDGDQSPARLRPVIIGVAFLDSRLNWCELAPKRDSASIEKLLRDLTHRSHLWARPRLDRGTRIIHSIVDFSSVLQAEHSQPRTSTLQLHAQPKAYLIYCSASGKVETVQLDEVSNRILSRCDGTHTVASILYEETLFGSSTEEILHRIRQLILDRIIVRFQFELTTP